MTGRIHIGKRIALLRIAHGDSLRQAAARTGVSHTTIARIENGQATTSFHSTLRKIAEGYGVTMEYLMTGRDPKQDFEASLRRLPADERTRLYFASTLGRTRMVLQFLIAEYPQEFPMDRLAEAIEVEPEVLQSLLEQGESSPLPPELIQRIGEDLSRLTGISRHWFRSGYLGTDQAQSIPPETFEAYIHLMKKAVRAGVKPDVLEMAIDLLIMKHREVSAAASRLS
ncbi:MAG: helix-turn-helix domain-containing protein [Bacillota bacterium]